MAVLNCKQHCNVACYNEVIKNKSVCVETETWYKVISLQAMFLFIFNTTYLEIKKSR